jgi:hypothetical protein
MDVRYNLLAEAKDRDGTVRISNGQETGVDTQSDGGDHWRWW